MSDMRLPLWLTAVLAANSFRARDIAMCSLDSATPMCDYSIAHVTFIDGSYIKLQVYNRANRPDLNPVPRGTGPKTMLERVADGEFEGQKVKFPRSSFDEMRERERRGMALHAEDEDLTKSYEVTLPSRTIEQIASVPPRQNLYAHIGGNQKAPTKP